MSWHHRVMEILEGGLAFLFLAASDSTYEQSDSSESKASRPFTSFIWDGFTVVCRSDRTNESDLIPSDCSSESTVLLMRSSFLLVFASQWLRQAKVSSSRVTSESFRWPLRSTCCRSFLFSSLAITNWLVICENLLWQAICDGCRGSVQFGLEVVELSDRFVIDPALSWTVRQAFEEFLLKMCSSLSHRDKSDPRSFHSESPPFKYWPGGGVDERLIEAAAASCLRALNWVSISMNDCSFSWRAFLVSISSASLARLSAEISSLCTSISTWAALSFSLSWRFNSSRSESWELAKFNWALNLDSAHGTEGKIVQQCLDFEVRWVGLNVSALVFITGK